MEIDGCFMCLRHLQVSWYVIQSSIFSEVCSRLFEVERNIGFDALLSDAKHPFVIADTGILARLTTDCYLLTPRAKSDMEIDGF